MYVVRRRKTFPSQCHNGKFSSVSLTYLLVAIKAYHEDAEAREISENTGSKFECKTPFRAKSSMSEMVLDLK